MRKKRSPGEICRIPGCGESVSAEGLCVAHHWRVKRHNDPHVGLLVFPDALAGREGETVPAPLPDFAPLARKVEQYARALLESVEASDLDTLEPQVCARLRGYADQVLCACEGLYILPAAAPSPPPIARRRAMCRHPGCEQAVAACGLCRAHYETARRQVFDALRRQRTPALCQVPRCPKLANASGACQDHFEAWLRAGAPFRSYAPRKTCQLPACDLPHYAYGLCRHHYDAEMSGAAFFCDRYYWRCGERDCDWPAFVSGYCIRHLPRPPAYFPWHDEARGASALPADSVPATVAAPAPEIPSDAKAGAPGSGKRAPARQPHLTANAAAGHAGHGARPKKTPASSPAATGPMAKSTGPLCWIAGCGHSAARHGLCRDHFRQWAEGQVPCPATGFRSDRCLVEACGQPPYIYQLCQHHYGKWQTGHLDMVVPLCRMPGCGRPDLGHGYCGAHRKGNAPVQGPRARDTASHSATVSALAAPAHQETVCRREGCGQKATAEGFCADHFEQWKKGGFPSTYNGFTRKGCRIEGCRRLSYQYQLCPAHYRDWSAGVLFLPTCRYESCPRPALPDGDYCGNHRQGGARTRPGQAAPAASAAPTRPRLPGAGRNVPRRSHSPPGRDVPDEAGDSLPTIQASQTGAATTSARRTSPHRRDQQATPAPCAVAGCNEPAFGRKFCRHHLYLGIMRSSDPAAADVIPDEWLDPDRHNDLLRCHVKKCRNPLYARGMCLEHYRRWQKLAAAQKRRATPP